MSRFCCKHAEGHIQLIFGPMFSGKTTEMLRRINRYKLANRVCRVVKYKADTRYDRDKVATHDLQMHDAVSAYKISEVWNDLLNVQVIGIDEGQFFEDIVEYCEKLANLGKVVIIAALDGDFNRKRFQNNSLDLFPLAECITKLTAVCKKCGEDAAFTFRLTSNLKQEVIGGTEMYAALCRGCYLDACKAVERHCGKIELILGPRFSGKTTELLRRRNRHALAGRNCKVVKYADGHRVYPNKVVTHDELVYDAITATRLEDILGELMSCEVVLIDNGQFFPDVVEISEHLANSGKIAIVSALDGDYNRKAFANGILDLCPLSESITKLCAVCSCCDNDAAFSRKLTGNSILQYDALYDKKKLYRAVCRTCYMQIGKCPLSVIQSNQCHVDENGFQQEQEQLNEKSKGSTKKCCRHGASTMNAGFVV